MTTTTGPVLTGENKALLLARVRAHAAADRIAQGAFFAADGGTVRVCALGCALTDPESLIDPDPADWYAAQEERWGIPAWLGRLEDGIFEGLPERASHGWPERFVAAIPADRPIPETFADRLGVARLGALLDLTPSWPAEVRAQVVAAIRGVIAALEHHDGAARAAAWSAAVSAARSADSAAGAAAWSAAWSAEWAADSAASAAASAAAWWAAGAAGSASGSAAQSAAQSAARSAWAAEADRLIAALRELG